MSHPSVRLRQQLAHGRLVVAPGVYDGFSARIVEAAGFPAAYLSGYSVSASFGYPDAGLLTMTEMVCRASSVARTIDLPLIADADTGYGGPLQVQRTVAEFEHAGAAAIHLEDEMDPKRHIGQVALLPLERMVAKIRAAVDARRDKDFMIIARTEALHVAGLKETEQRLLAYAQAGADALMVVGIQEDEHLRHLPTVTAGVPHVALASAMATLGARYSVAELGAMGYQIVLLPTALLLWAGRAMVDGLRAFESSGVLMPLVEGMLPVSECAELLRSGDAEQRMAHYGPYQTQA